MINGIERKTWEEFRKTGLLWWINRTLHLFGWSIVYGYNENDELASVFPARVNFRGFEEELETKGFKDLTGYLKEEVDNLVDEANS